MTVASALTVLTTTIQAAATAGNLSTVRATSVYAAPPETAPTLPAIIHQWQRSTFGQFPYDAVATGNQLETATIEALVLTNAPTFARAMPIILTIVNGYRIALAGKQALGDSVRQCRMTAADGGEIEYNGQMFFGVTITLEALIFHDTTWTE